MAHGIGLRRDGQSDNDGYRNMSLDLLWYVQGNFRFEDFSCILPRAT